MNGAMVRAAVVGVAVVLVSAPAAADHVKETSGFLESAVSEAQARRPFVERRAGSVELVPASEVSPKGRPAGPRGQGPNPGNNDRSKDRGPSPAGEDSLFGSDDTIVVPDSEAPALPSAGFGGQDLSGTPGEPTPEPGTLLLLGAGLGGALLHRARRRRTNS